MIKVKLNKVNVTSTEIQIAEMLIKSIKKETKGLACNCCDQDSEIILHVDNTKMSVLRTEIQPCCNQFSEIISHQLFEAEPA